jgi:hypothetical protein
MRKILSLTTNHYLSETLVFRQESHYDKQDIPCQTLTQGKDVFYDVKQESISKFLFDDDLICLA